MRGQKPKKFYNDDAAKLAFLHDGEVLTKYENSKTKMKWRCEEGHEWWQYLHVARRYWCRKCSRILIGKKLRLDKEIYKKRAEEANSEFLRLTYKDNTAFVTRRCECGMVIETHASTLLYERKKGCYYCSRVFVTGENSFHWKPNVPRFKGLTREQEVTKLYNANYRKIKSIWTLRKKHWKEVMLWLESREVSEEFKSQAMRKIDWDLEKRYLIRRQVSLKQVPENLRVENLIMAIKQVVRKSEEHLLGVFESQNSMSRHERLSLQADFRNHLDIEKEVTQRVVVDEFNNPQTPSSTLSLDGDWLIHGNQE